jgi:two-component system, chemotaxis family, chemotaxis protein CheY
MRAIVIDDSRAIRVILGKMLRDIGFDVSEAPDGQAALDVLRASEVFDLALVDWNMPGMDGLQLVQATRADPRFDRMRIMMVTTENEVERIVRALEAGANEYLMKPFTSEAVTEKLALLGLVEAA